METTPPNAETMNAIVRGLAAVVLAVSRRMSAADRAAFAADLAHLAEVAERNGSQAEEALLLNLYRAAAMPLDRR